MKHNHSNNHNEIVYNMPTTYYRKSKTKDSGNLRVIRKVRPEEEIEGKFHQNWGFTPQKEQKVVW
jgi:hypothetical protein